MTDPTEVLDEDLVRELLKAAGEGADRVAIRPCDGGGNNRVFIIEGTARRHVAKLYFTHPSDTRDRLHAEFAFLQYAHDVGVKSVPRPLACLPERRLALYQYIDGHKLAADQLTQAHVGQAADLFLALNGPTRVPLAGGLPPASEASFTIADQIATVRSRVERLQNIAPSTAEHGLAIELSTKIERALRTVSDHVANRAQQAGQDITASLAPDERCISPSDFGFHNALRQQDGQIIFLDFEYAGWDDPSKMACDFFCQPAVPVARSYFEEFLERTAGFSRETQRHVHRAYLMMPLFQIKWCCIMLNEFLPDSARRRRFANPTTASSQHRQQQLNKVTQLLNSITS